ncbi:MAG TPA: IS5 family transposase, partial [Chloroflexota bacterium]|nr:IS5 family transposase [Chloroflexota bacterium]
EAGVGAGVPGRVVRPGQKGGPAVGLTRKGKGTKWMLVVDGNGVPLGFRLESAQKNEVELAPATLETVRVAKPPGQGRAGRPRTRPAQLVADRGYHSAALRRYLRRRGIACCIPPLRRPAGWRPRRGRPVTARREDYARRWVVERTFAWLGNQRRLLVRHERLLATYHGFFAVALSMICLTRVLE